MAQTLKVLGQADLAATTLTDVYTVPGGTSTTISTVFVCNKNASARTIRIAVAIAGASDDPEQYLYHTLSIAAYDTFAVTAGITLASTDVLRAYASGADVSVNVFGVEVS